MVDQISILIIKGSNTSLVDAEAFVRNRGWRVKSLTDIREAIEYIVKSQPQYVLIACDHPNKKVKVLPKLLAQSMLVRIVMIAESSAPSSIMTLQALGHTNLILPPVTGPAIERTILKMRKTEAEDLKELEHQRIVASYAGTSTPSRSGASLGTGASFGSGASLGKRTAAETFTEWQDRTRTTRSLETSVPSPPRISNAPRVSDSSRLPDPPCVPEEVIFLKTARTIPYFEESANEPMVRISIDEIRVDVPLDFDIYLYLPMNKRYVLYGSQGRKFQGAQKIRLQEKGVRHMHLRREAIADAKRHQAHDFLNSMVVG